MSSHDPLSLVGATIDRKYAIEKCVGEGGFGYVYRAKHTLLGQPVAIKFFRLRDDLGSADSARVLQDLVREGALHAQISARTASVVQAHDIGSWSPPGGGSVPYIVLEWLEGRTLQTVLQAERPNGQGTRWSWEQAWAVLDPVAQALEVAHACGIAHRDVKPANIFIVSDGQTPVQAVKILYFGIAKIAYGAAASDPSFSRTDGNPSSFTPRYGAPEQFSRGWGAIGPWTDVYALALILTELVVGHPPLQGQTVVQLGLATSDPVRRPTPRQLGAVLSDESEYVFRKALAVRPEDRYATVSQFWPALGTSLERAGVLGVGLRARRPRLKSDPSTRGASPVDSAPVGSATHTALPLPHPTVTAFSLSTPAHSTLLSSQQAPGLMLRPATSPSPPAAPSALAMQTAFLAIPPLPSPSSMPAAVPPGPFSESVLPLPTTTSRPPPHLGSTHRGLVGFLVAGVSLAVALVAVFVGARSSRWALGWMYRDASPHGSAPSASAVAIPVGKPREDCPPRMARIEGGKLFMGSEDLDAMDDEKPSHQVILSPYCIDLTEVTTEAYRACSDSGECRRASAEVRFPDMNARQQDAFSKLCNRDRNDAREHPINCVDWQMASEYCAVQKKRLPTEAEWEYASRGSDGRLYPWGMEPPDATRLNACGAECRAWERPHGVAMSFGNHAMYATDDGHAATAPVGSYPAGKSPFGLLDMAGNVWEWTSDWDGPYAGTAVDPRGPAEGVRRVVRGGAFNGIFPSWVRATRRYSDEPGTRSHAYGFRCAKSWKGAR